MTNEIRFDFGKLELILICIIIIGLSIYFYFELQKMKKSIQLIELKLTPHLNQPDKTQINNPFNHTDDVPNISPINKFNEDIRQDNTEKLVNNHDSHDNNNHEYHDNDIHDNDIHDMNIPSEKHIQNIMDHTPESELDNSTVSDYDSESSSDGYSSDNQSEIKDKSNGLDSETDINININSNTVTNTNEIIPDSLDPGIKHIIKDYNNMTVSELKKILTDLNLPTSGNKTKLIQRIQENKTLQF